MKTTKTKATANNKKRNNRPKSTRGNTKRVRFETDSKTSKEKPNFKDKSKVALLNKREKEDKEIRKKFLDEVVESLDDSLNIKPFSRQIANEYLHFGAPKLLGIPSTPKSHRKESRAVLQRTAHSGHGLCRGP